MYAYTSTESIRRMSDGACVPITGTNADYVEYLQWVSAGNTPAPYVPHPPTEEDYGSTVQRHVDATAKARGYLDAVTCTSYVASTNAAWKADADVFIAWRDSIWAYVYDQLAAVHAGQRVQPTPADLVAEFPEIAWPAP